MNTTTRSAPPGAIVERRRVKSAARVEGVRGRRSADAPPTIVGVAAVFDRPTTIAGEFVEIIRPGAFRRALRERQDVRALVNHEPNMVLGRTASGTLRLRETPRGLEIELDPPPTQVARDLVELVRRADVDQMSFAFSIPPGGERWMQATKGKMPTRELLDVDLYDVSIVTFPAYDGTEAKLARTVRMRAQLEALERRSPRRDPDWDRQARRWLVLAGR